MQINQREGHMRPVTKPVKTLIATVAIASLALALNLATMPSAHATPEMAKGKACDTCHTGAPPTKANAKKEEPKKDAPKKDAPKK